MKGAFLFRLDPYAAFAYRRLHGSPEYQSAVGRRTDLLVPNIAKKKLTVLTTCNTKSLHNQISMISSLLLLVILEQTERSSAPNGQISLQ